MRHCLHPARPRGLRLWMGQGDHAALAPPEQRAVRLRANHAHDAGRRLLPPLLRRLSAARRRRRDGRPRVALVPLRRHFGPRARKAGGHRAALATSGGRRRRRRRQVARAARRVRDLLPARRVRSRDDWRLWCGASASFGRRAHVCARALLGRAPVARQLRVLLAVRAEAPHALTAGPARLAWARSIGVECRGVGDDARWRSALHVSALT
mmetsp:Transcript_24562/g.79318  ORF Transcript_24562/g.79318 Transcript_24562/m.79318 type:complete len:210 (-) Transcript_24562:256-885(-)